MHFRIHRLLRARTTINLNYLWYPICPIAADLVALKGQTALRGVVVSLTSFLLRFEHNLYVFRTHNHGFMQGS